MSGNDFTEVRRKGKHSMREVPLDKDQLEAKRNRTTPAKHVVVPFNDPAGAAGVQPPQKPGKDTTEQIAQKREAHARELPIQVQLVGAWKRNKRPP
jgi:hypothetical protein